MVGQSNVLGTLTPKHTPNHLFQFHPEQKLDVDECKLGEELNANNDK